MKRLGPDERAILLDLIATRRPAYSYPRIATLFFWRTHSTISPTHVYRTERFGFRGPPGITVEQRVELQAIIADASPGRNRTEIAAEFEHVTGRPISLATVRREIRSMGYRIGKPGARRPRRPPSRQADRAEQAEILRAVHTLPAKVALAVRLTIEWDLCQRHAAGMMGCSQAEVARLVRRARKLCSSSTSPTRATRPSA